MLKKTSSPQETKHIASKFAGKIIKKECKRASIITLRGELGSGKTAFVRGFLKSLGVKRSVQSPTFVLIKWYPLPAYRRTVVHIDAYRIKNERELRTLRFGDILKDKNNIVLIEWPERIKGAIPDKRTRIDFYHGKKQNERFIEIKMQK